MEVTATFLGDRLSHRQGSHGKAKHVLNVHDYNCVNCESSGVTSNTPHGWLCENCYNHDLAVSNPKPRKV